MRDNILPTFKFLKTFIFDFDGVILDSISCKTEAFYQIYLKYGKEIADKVKQFHIKNGGMSRFEKFKYWHENYLNTKISDKEINDLSNKLSNIVFEKVVRSKQIEGSFEFIRKHSKNYNFFIVSGTPHEEIKKIAKDIKIEKYFIEILGSPTSKDQWCRHLLKKYKLEPSQTIFLGDAISDFNAAKISKFHFALRIDENNKDLFQTKDVKIDFNNFEELENKLSYPRPKILVTTTSFQDSPGAHKTLLRRQNWNVDFLRGPLKKDEIINVVDQYDGILCGDDQYDQEVIEKGAKGSLKVLSKYGVGLDKIDTVVANNLNVKVTNCPSINQVSVAEHVIALIFSFEKNIPSQYNSVKQGEWIRKVGYEIRGKRLGIIGLGAIGKELSIIASNIGLNVFFYDLNPDKDFQQKNPKVKFQKMEELIINSNYISLHVPLNKSTREMINITSFSNMRKDAVLINTARAGLIQKKDLIESLKKKQIRGYLCDVLDFEPVQNDEKLLEFENVIITPHVGSRTKENIEKQGLKSLKNLIVNL
jgi:D-3-phosphoglycerate dehydrogenase